MKDNKMKTSKKTSKKIINHIRKNKSSKPKKLSRKVLRSRTSSIKNKSNSKYNTKSNTKSNSKKPQTIQQLIKTKVLKEPSNLRVGYVSKEINGKRYVVRLDEKNKKHFAIANKQEIACHLKLKENMNKFIGIYKTGNSSFRSIKGAISFAIRETEREFPKCTTSKGKYNKDRENRTYRRAAYDNYNYYKKYWYYKVANYLKGLRSWKV
jgi:hypothetical protein